MVADGTQSADIRWQRVARHLGEVDGVVAVYLLGKRRARNRKAIQSDDR